MAIIPVEKDLENQKPIPTSWRDTIVSIVEAIKLSDYVQLNAVFSVSKEDFDRIQENVEEYGEDLDSLPEATWNTSACQWVEDYWDVIVDLYTIDEGESDLSLSLRVFEENKGFKFLISSVHVE